jgi:diguanylate cyclase (GGDEF)-like protein
MRIRIRFERIVGDTMENKQSLNNLKSELFELLASDEATTHIELLSGFGKKLQQFFSAEIVTIFTHVDCKKYFIPEFSTNMHVMNDPELLMIKDNSTLYEFLTEGKPYIDFFLTHYIVYLPQMNENIVTSLVSIQFSSMQKGQNIDEWNEVGKVCGYFLKKSNKLIVLFEEEQRYEQLYRVTSKFHSTMNMDDVLNEIILTLKEVCPHYSYYLLLSQDNSNLNNLPIKELPYEDENLPETKAYVTGELQIEEVIKKRSATLYAPLKGKQGIYGVLQVEAPNTIHFPKQELSFIMLLAITAGSALENAKLYQQSKRVISDLQLINETSHQLNSDLRLNEAMTFMSKQIVNSFNADEVGFIVFDEQFENKLLPGSTGFFLTNVSRDFINFIYEKIKEEKEAIFVGDILLDSNNIQRVYRSVMVVPMVQSGDLRGLAIVLHKSPYYFSFETFKLLQALIHHSTLAFTNSILREELEKLVITDHLTKLHSRKHLNEKIVKSMQTDAFGTFILIDIDNFKSVNDQYGHQVGDEVLKQVANIILENIRELDVGARWGGEELAVYLPKVELNAGIAIARRLVDKVEEHTNPGITISCGVGHWTKGEQDTPITLFKRADEALYRAKGTGKNKVSIQS